MRLLLVLLLAAITGPCMCQYLFGKIISPASNTPTDPQVFSKGVSAAADYFEYLPNNPLMCFSQTSPDDTDTAANPQLRCFNYIDTRQDGKVLAAKVNQVAALPSSVYGLAMHQALRVVIVSVGTDLVDFTLQRVGTTYSFSNTYTKTMTATTQKGTASRALQTTNYVYSGPSKRTTPAGNALRYDISSKQLISAASVVTLDETNPASSVNVDTMKIDFWNDKVIMIGYFRNLLFYTQDLSSYVSYDPGQQLFSGIVCNLKANTMYIGEGPRALSTDDHFIHKIDLANPDGTNVRKLASQSETSSTDLVIIGMFNMGSLNYLAAFKEGATSVFVYDKDTMVRYGTWKTQIQNYVQTIVTGRIVGDRHYFSHIQIIDPAEPWYASFSSYYVYFDRCSLAAARSLEGNKICTACQANSYMYATDVGAEFNECYLKQDIPRAGFGMDISLTPQLIRACPNCADCFENSAQCTLCEPGYYFFYPDVNTVTCISQVPDNLKYLNLLSAKFYLTDGRIELRFDAMINFEIIKQTDITLSFIYGATIPPDVANVPFTMQKLSTGDGVSLTIPAAYRYYPYQRIKLSTKLYFAVFYSADMKSAYKKKDAEFYIEKPSGLSLVEELVMSGDFSRVKGVYAEMSKVLSWIAKISNFCFKVLLGPLDFMMGFTVDRVTATFSFFRHLAGVPTLRTMTMLYYLSSTTYFGFTVSNPHSRWSSDSRCIPSPNYQTNGIRCNIFRNYGHNLDILFAAIVVSFISYCLGTFLAPKVGNFKVRHILSIIGYFFGVRYFLLWMDAVLIEVFGLVLLDLSTDTNTSSRYLGGFFMSLILLLYYIGFYCLVLVAIFKMNRKAQTESLHTLPKDSFQYKQQGLAALTCLFHDYRDDLLQRRGLLKLFVYFPLVTATKNITVQILVAANGSHPRSQLIPIVCVEFLYCILLIIGRVKSSWIDNSFDISISVISIFFILCKLAMTDKSFTPQQIHEDVDINMAVALMVMAYLTVLYLFSRYRYIRSSIKSLSPSFKLTAVLPVSQTPAADFGHQDKKVLEKQRSADANKPESGNMTPEPKVKINEDKPKLNDVSSERGLNNPQESAMNLNS
jgi:hypothetical protein